MQPPLLQAELDVRKKTRANTFNWRGQFTPQLIEYLLATYAQQEDVVADPFSGSGTVLAECAARNLQCFGLEINPAAYTMSKFYSLANLPGEERADILEELQRKISRLLCKHGDLPVWYESESYREQYQNLTDFARELFPQLERGLEKVLGLNLLFLCEGHKKLSLHASTRSALNSIRQAALALPFSECAVQAKLLDARAMHTLESLRANLIITSPPYINVFNYHQNYRAILEAVGWDMLHVAASEFGSNRKNRGNRFRTVVQYSLDIEQALRSFWHGLHDGGLMVIVIGRESNVRGMPFYNGQIVKEIAQGTEGFDVVAESERAFTNKFGLIIKEDVLVFEKKPVLPDRAVAHEIAARHLKAALLLATAPDVRADITDALEGCDAITASALFQPRKAKVLDHA